MTETMTPLNKLAAEAHKAGRIANYTILDQAKMAGYDPTDAGQSAQYLDRITDEVVAKIDAVETMIDVQTVAAEALRTRKWLTALECSEHAARLTDAMNRAQQRVQSK